MTPHHPTFESMDFSKGGVEKSVFCAVCASFCPCWIEDTESRLEGHSGQWADCDTCGQVTEVLPPIRNAKVLLEAIEAGGFYFCEECESITSDDQRDHEQTCEALVDPILQVTYDPTKTDDGGDAFDLLILDALSTQEQTDGGAEGCSTSRTIYAHYATTDEADEAAEAVEALGLSGVVCEVFVAGGY
jgi:hypothetical protein